MIYFILAALIALIDQASKYFLSLQISPGDTVELIPGIVRMIYVENTGAAFSFLSDRRWLLVAISAIVIVLVVYFMLRVGKNLKPVGMLSLAVVLGGAVGNFIDRVLFGYVADFFEFEFVHFAIFNVADIFITVGGIAFCIYYIFSRDDILKDVSWGFGGKKKKQAAGGDTEDDDGADPS